MKKTILWVLWALLYGASVALGTITQAEGLLRIALVLCGIVFFVPGFLLLLDAVKRKDRKSILVIRYIALGSLVLTILTLFAIVFSVTSSGDAWGIVLQVILSFVSAPMLCIRYWAVSLFLWACLLYGTFFLKNNQKS